jgi:ribonuclease P protein component
MLKKINRLTKDKNFNNVFNPSAGRSKSSYDKITGVKAAANKEECSRFGVLVGTKISKKAVIRNKIKRQIREIIRKNLKNIKSGYDYIIITQPAIKDKGYREIEESMCGNFKKLGLYGGHE